jgi:hypothetical protein
MSGGENAQFSQTSQWAGPGSSRRQLSKVTPPLRLPPASSTFTADADADLRFPRFSQEDPLRPPARPLPPVPRGDVGAIQLLRHARPARPLPGRPGHRNEPRPRLVEGGRRQPLRLVHGHGLPPARFRWVDRGQADRRASLNAGRRAGHRPGSRRAGLLRDRTARAKPSGHVGLRRGIGADRDRHRPLQTQRLRHGRRALPAGRPAA